MIKPSGRLRETRPRSTSARRFPWCSQRGRRLSSIWRSPGPAYEFFADLKDSMELLADRDPEEARKLLDPVLEHMMEAVHRYEGTVN